MASSCVAFGYVDLYCVVLFCVTCVLLCCVYALFYCSTFFWLGKDYSWCTRNMPLWILFLIPTVLCGADFVYVTFKRKVSTVISCGGGDTRYIVCLCILSVCVNYEPVRRQVSVPMQCLGWQLKYTLDKFRDIPS